MLNSEIKNERRYLGIAPDDDADIRVIDDISALRGGDPEGGGLWLEARSLLRDIIFAGVIAILIVVFVVQPVRVEGQSMMPRLYDQDRIFVNKFIYPLREWLGDREPIKRGDIVVLLFPVRSFQIVHQARCRSAWRRGEHRGWPPLY